MSQGRSPKFSAETVLVALGSNQASTFGGPAEMLGRAVAELDGGGLELVATSRFFETPCFPPGSGPDFVNAAVRLETRLPPKDVLSRLHEIERAHGRERAQRWAQRTLDLDLIAYGDSVLPDRATVQRWIDLPLAEQKSRAPDTLILPHPRLQDRAFVLIPLADVAPDWRHPVLGKTIREMADALPESDKKDIRAMNPGGITGNIPCQ